MKVNIPCTRFSKAFSVNNKRPITVHEIMARYIRNCQNKKYRNYVGYTFRMMERIKRLQRLQKKSIVLSVSGFLKVVGQLTA